MKAVTFSKQAEQDRFFQFANRQWAEERFRRLLAEKIERDAKATRRIHRRAAGGE